MAQSEPYSKDYNEFKKEINIRNPGAQIGISPQ